MGSGLLGDFPRVLRSSDFADLGKRCRCRAFLAKFACKTAQKLRAAFAGRKGAFVPDERISVSRSSGRGEQGTEVCSDVRREFDDVIGYDVSKEELVCIAGTLKRTGDGGAFTKVRGVRAFVMAEGRPSPGNCVPRGAKLRPFGRARSGFSSERKRSAMTEKISIEEARLAVRGKFEENGDPSWDDTCALILEIVCFAAQTFADGTWEDLNEMLKEAVAFDENGENSLAYMIDAWSGGLEARDFDESADWRNAFEQVVYSADREAYRQTVARVRSELEIAAHE